MTQEYDVEQMQAADEGQELPGRQTELSFGGRVGMFLLCLGLIVLGGVTVGDVALRLLTWLLSW